MTRLTYDEVVRELFPRLSGGIKWGLERTRRLLDAVGSPDRRYPTVHIGGTNGKGSVAATIASVLREAGVRTGLYTSPHLCEFRERIQVDGAPIGESALVAAAERLWPAIRREGPTFFEATTAIAFEAFAEAGIDLAVVEVGLGGRLDATNVIEPDLTIVTNVALDHAEFLGREIESVAREKAGIIKPDVPALVGEPDPRIRALLEERAHAVGAPFHTLDPSDVDAVRVAPDATTFRLSTRPWGELELCTPLAGVHQAGNAAIAVRALELLADRWRPGADAVRRGVAGVYWPGRMQIERDGGRTEIFDVAHNPAGVHALVSALSALGFPRPLVVLAAVLKDKDRDGMIQPLIEAADRIVLTIPPSVPPHRRWDPVAARDALGVDRVDAVPDFERALARVHRLAHADGPGTVVVTGSFHTVGDAFLALGRAPWSAGSRSVGSAETALPAAASPA